MKIVILSREYPPHTVHVSTAVFYQDLAKTLTARGHEVHVICQSEGKPCQRTDEGVMVHEVGTHAERGSPLARISYSISAWRKLRELVSQDGIELVHAQYFLGEGLLYGLFKSKAPLIIHAFAWAEGWLLGDTLYQRIQRRLASFLEKIAAKRADKIIVSSEFVYRWAVEDLGTPEERVVIIHEPFDAQKFGPLAETSKEHFGVPSDRSLVLFVAALEPRKGPYILTQAIPKVLQHIPNTTFLIVGRDTNMAPGGGSMQVAMQTLAEKEGCSTNLLFTGFLSSEELLHAYAACDIFVWPSLLEAGGNPPLQVMAWGKPMVATATGITAEFDGISDALLVVPPGNPEVLAQAITKLLSIPREEREHLAAGHRQIVEESFSFQPMVDSFLAVYEGVIAEHRRKR